MRGLVRDGCQKFVGVEEFSLQGAQLRTGQREMVAPDFIVKHSLPLRLVKDTH